MTLFKQIMIVAIIFVISIFVFVGYQNYKTANEFIDSQLSTNARHTAISLGLAIQNSQDPTDVGIDETMINAIFDSGYYEHIKLVDINNKVLVDRYQPSNFEGVPNWFVKNIKLSAPTESTEIMHGWTKFATLYVQGNTGIAYYQLYNTLKDIFITLCILTFIVLLICYFGLAIILKPLYYVKIQAEKILDNEFIIEKKIPFTVDIRQIVLAMNNMVGKVKDIFEQEISTLVKYEELLYKDSISKLYNRRYFQTRFSEITKSEDYSSGTAIMFSIKELGQLKKIIGYDKSFSFIIKIGEILLSHSTDMNSFCARLNDNDFIIMVPNESALKCKGIAENIMKEIEALYGIFCIPKEDLFTNASIVQYYAGMDIKKILTIADVTLVNATQSYNFAIKIYEEQGEIVLGRENYRELILNSMANNNFKFATQEIHTVDNAIDHIEIFLRLVDNNQIWQKASYFMPMVNELDLGVRLDMYVINKAINMLSNNALPDADIAINLGKELINSTAELYSFLYAIKKMKKQTSRKIYFEVPNRDDIISENLMNLYSKIKEFGFGFGIDHFILNLDSIEKLKDLSPDYLKIDASYILDIFSEEGSRDTRQSLDIILKSKNIRVIATGIEMQEQKEALQNLGVIHYQGDIISKVNNIG